MSVVINRDIGIRQGAEYREEMRRIEPRYLFEAVNKGTSGASAPTWPTALGDTVTGTGTPAIRWLSKGIWQPAVNPDTDVWLSSYGYARRAKVITPIAAVDLTSYTGAFQIRENLTDAATIHTGVVGFGVRSNGEFDMVIATADTTAFDFVDATYDLELTNGAGEVDFVVRGKAFLTKEVTR